MTTGTERYYDRRANEYDQVYEIVEQQNDLAELRTVICDALAGRRVLELAAGTGFWTYHLADEAVSVTATDVNDSTLAVARSRRDWPGNVRFEQADAFDLARIEGDFDALFAGFFWSHVPLDRVGDLLAGIVERVEPGSVVLFVDSNSVHVDDHPIVRTDEDGNTFQLRVLRDGTEWEVLKNFPDLEGLEETLGGYGEHVEVDSLEYFWTARFDTEGSGH